MLCPLGSRSLSTPLCSITVEIRFVIMIALPFPGDKGVNGCLCSIQRDCSGTPLLCYSRFSFKSFDILGNAYSSQESDEKITSTLMCVQ